jgi:phosphinothricin acetyltransferase
LIRKATEADVEVVARIWREGVAQAIGRTTPPMLEVPLRGFFHQRIRAAEPPFGFWVAEAVDRTVIGWQALLPFNNNPAMRPCLAESSTYVATAHARNGVGEALIRHAMRLAGESTLQYILGFISAENGRSLAMVEKCGWLRVGLIPGTQKEPATPDIVMVAFVPGQGEPGPTIHRL